MRISHRLVAQYIDTPDGAEDKVVLVDDESGAEYAFPVADIPGLARSMSFAQTDTDDDIKRGDVVVHRHEFPGLVFALGYFWRSAQ